MSGNKNNSPVISRWKYLNTYLHKDDKDENEENEENEDIKNEEKNEDENGEENNGEGEQEFIPFIDVSLLKNELKNKADEQTNVYEKQIIEESIDNLDNILKDLHKLGKY
jgi:hypothetical protein